MDYEKKYKEALDRARIYRDNAKAVEAYSAVARYENIFPELQESKDEKTRKQLINICNEWLGGGYSARPCLNDIRWLKNLLEKQKEPKHAPDDLQKSFEAGQTSIVDNPEQYGLCKKAEWSEEDEMLMDELESYILYDKEFNDEQKSWRIKRLKSLRPRPSWKPSEQKEQKIYKWSKKDKKILQSLHHVMNCADAQNAVKRDGLSVADVCNFLFSIEPSWKPSEEQMEVLLNAEGLVRANNYNENAKILASLYEQLKKL